MSGISIVILFIVIAIIIVVFLGVKIISQGQQATVERFGKYSRTLHPGINFIIPVFDRIGRRLNMMEQVMDVPSQEVITRDNAMVRVDGVAFFQINDAAQAAYQVNNLTLSIINLIMTNIRTVMGSMDLDELLSKRDDINARLLSVVDHATAPWGIKVTRIEIKDIAPPRDLIDAMARQMKAEREKRANILEAEGQKQGIILDAEARKTAAFMDAEARERLAQAEAAATRMVSDAISDGNVQAINYFIAQKYVEAFAKIAESKNDKIIMMPMEATGIVSSLAGITDLVKSTSSNK